MTDAPERIWAFGWQDGGTPLAGDWIDERQEAPDCATEYITVAASDARSAHYKRNMREKYDAFTAMRNDINVLIGDMASSVSTLQYGPGMTHECAAVSESVAKYVAASDARIEAAVRAAIESAKLCAIDDMRQRNAGHENPLGLQIAISKLAHALDALHTPVSRAAVAGDEPATRIEQGVRAGLMAAAVRIVSFDKGTIMHSPPQLLTDAHDQICALAAAPATVARIAKGASDD